MNGRVENDIKIFKQIEKDLYCYPSYVNSWYYYLKANGKSAMSCKDYINKVVNFLKFTNKNVKKVDVNNIKEDNIINYFINLKLKDDNTETSVSYRQCVWSCLNNFYNFLYKRELINKNYFESSGIERPKGNDLDRINRNRVLLTKNDFRKIISVVDNGTGSKKAKTYQKKYRNRDKAILLILMTTGIRKTALEEINVRDIDFENHILSVIDKGHKVHTYYLNDEVIEVIQKWLDDRFCMLGEKNDGALFISRDNKRMCGNSISKLVDKYSTAALGYSVSPHKFRSGFVSIIYDETKDIEFARRAVGHKNITTTQRYIVTDNKEKERAAAIIGNII